MTDLPSVVHRAIEEDPDRIRSTIREQLLAELGRHTEAICPFYLKDTLEMGTDYGCPLRLGPCLLEDGRSNYDSCDVFEAAHMLAKR